MAKSKAGGTRSYLRGRVGADVYSIGKDGLGKKQQVVRSLAETVANPQTQAQMRGRMIMSTIMQSLAGLRPIVDHSFDGVSGKQPNISKFIKENYGLIKADIASHPSSGNAFGLNKWQEKGAKRGAYVISDGQATVPAALALTKSSGTIAIALTSGTLTIGGLKAALGMTTEEYFTLVGIATDGTVKYERFRVNPTLADSTVISGSNIADVFAVEGNATASISLSTYTINIVLSSVATCCAVIVSLKTANGFIHNRAVLGEGTGFDFNSDAALPTYPVGSENYLNGGDIFGGQESFNPGGDEPQPVPPSTNTLTIVKTGEGSSDAWIGNTKLSSGDTVEAGTQVDVSIVPIPDTDPSAQLDGVALQLTLTQGVYRASFTMPEGSATLSMFSGYEG